MTATVPEVVAAGAGSPGFQRVRLESAACRDETSDLFFSPSLTEQTAAKRVCAQCDVRLECLLYALETRQQYGVWGGLATEERRLMRRLVAQEVAS